MSYSINKDIYDTALGKTYSMCPNPYIVVIVNNMYYNVGNVSFSKSDMSASFTGNVIISNGGPISLIEFGLKDSYGNKCASAQYDLTQYNLSIPNNTMLSVVINISLSTKTG